MPGAQDDEIRQVLAEGASQLQRLKLDRALTSPLLRFLRQDSQTVDSVMRLGRELEAAAALFRETGARIDVAERAQAQQEPLGEAWWNAVRRELANQADDTGYRASWTGTWVEALAADRYDRADEVADLARWTDEEQRIRDRMREVSAAFTIGRRADALPALTDLVRDGSSLPAEVTVPLAVLRARVHLQETGDTAAALHAAREAVAMTGADQPNTYALALAADAEVHLERGELDLAAASLDRTQPLSAIIPEPLIIAGMLAARRAAWQRMDEFYDEAVRQTGEQIAQPQLLRPAPANLLWRLARHLRASDPTGALNHLDAALARGVIGAGEYPDRQALCDRGRLLDSLERSNEAATAYGAAADRYAWSGLLPRAVGLYEHACALAPDNAQIRWNFADALRGQIEDADTVLDEKLARRAYRLLREGLDEKRPDRDDAWVLATQALLAHALGDEEVDPTLLLERALLLNDGIPWLYPVLATLLREAGQLQEAAAAARQGYDRYRRDAVVADLHAATIADQGDYRGALGIVNAFRGRRSDSLLPLRTAVLHLRVNEPEAALDAIACEPASEMVRLVRGIAYERSGDWQAAHAEYEKVWSGEGAGSRRNLAWAAYRTGRLDEAAEILEALAARRPRDPAFALDLGQVLVVRGDLDAGARTLRDAVQRCTLVEDLVHLADVDLPVARANVAGRPHELAALSVLDEVAALVHRRCARLRVANRPKDSVSARAARARTAHAEGRLDEAIDLYHQLVDDHTIPEAGLGLARAAQALLDHGDRLLTAGDDAGAARTLWERALRGASPPLPTTRPLAGQLLARIALSHLEEGDTAAAADLLADAFPVADGALAAALAPALAVLARNVPAVWRLREGLQTVIDEPRRAGEPRGLIDTADSVPLAAAYQLDRAAVPGSAVFPLVTPVEVRVPERLENLVGSPDLGERVAALRQGLTEETGVRIPGVRVVLVPGGDRGSNEVSFCVYGQVVKRVPPGPELPVDLTLLIRQLEAVVRNNLYRMISPDDVELWLGGWDDPALAAVNGPLIDAPSRLRLVRVLRLLLREGVPIIDRAAILAGFRAAETAGSPGLLDTVRTVRRHLASAGLGRRPGIGLVAVPAELEDRVRGGLGPGRAAWRMDHAPAAALLNDLTRWRDRQPAEIGLTVRAAETRPFVWRLLASAGRPTLVLSLEELQ